MSVEPPFEQFFAYRRFQPVVAFDAAGEHVLFSSNISGQFNLWRVAVDGGWPQQLTAFSDRTVRAAAVQPGEHRWQRVEASSGRGTPPAQCRTAGGAGQGAHVDITRRVRIPAKRTAPVDQELTGHTEWRGCSGNRQPPDDAAIEQG